MLPVKTNCCLMVFIGAFLCWVEDVPSQIKSIQMDVVYHTENALKIRQLNKLAMEKNWEQLSQLAIEQLANPSSLVGEQPIKIKNKRLHETVLRCSALDLVNETLATIFRDHPPAQQEYRKQVAAKADQQFKSLVDESDIGTLQRYVNEFAFSEYGEQALLMLGDRYFENSQLAQARQCWNRLRKESKQTDSADGGSSNTQAAEPSQRSSLDLTGSWRIPIPETHQADIEARFLLATLEERQFATFENAFRQFESRWSQAQTQVNGKPQSWLSILRRAEQSAIGRETSFENSSRPDEDFDPILDPVWEVQFDQTGQAIRNHTADICLPVGGIGAQAVFIAPLIDQQTIVWQNGREVQMKKMTTTNLTDPKTSKEDAVLLETLWKSSIESKGKGKSPLPDLKAFGTARYRVIKHNRHLFARVGSPLITAKTDQTNFQSALIGINLDGMRMLPGFPLLPPTPRFEFLGSPVVDNAGVYVALIKRVGAQVELHVAHYDHDLSAMNENRLPTWMTFICRAENYGQLIDGTMSRDVIAQSKDAIVCGGILGTITVLNKNGGQVRWLGSYQRHQLLPEKPNHRMLNYFRCEAPWVDENRIILAPNDNPSLYCFDLITGNVLWSRDLPDVNLMLGQDKLRYIMTGDRLYWINKTTGQVAAAYPALQGTAEFGTARPRPRCTGRGMITSGQIFYPIKDELLVFDLKLGVSPDHRWKSPILKKRIALEQGTIAQSIHHASGLLIIVNDKGMTAYR